MEEKPAVVAAQPASPAQEPAAPKEPAQPSPPEEVEVKTYLGRLRGYRNKLEKREGYIYSFLGVPYAQPPVGKRRFKAPLPVTAFKSDEAFGFRAECAQVKAYGEKRFQFVGSEDCLTLNVFSPSLTQNKAKTLFQRVGNYSPNPEIQKIIILIFKLKQIRGTYFRLW